MPSDIYRPEVAFAAHIVKMFKDDIIEASSGSDSLALEIVSNAVPAAIRAYQTRCVQVAHLRTTIGNIQWRWRFSKKNEFKLLRTLKKTTKKATSAFTFGVVRTNDNKALINNHLLTSWANQWSTT